MGVRFGALPALAASLFLSLAAAAGAESLDDLAHRGATLARQDPLVAALRSQEPDRSRARGFDIGIAAAGADTLPGPGKQKIHDSLQPREQAGFETAVSFALERNRNAALAARGVAIANADPLVASARTLNPDGFYRLGFDIGVAATEHDTLPGPGKQKIHDSLSPRAQTGFDKAVSFSLERNRHADLAARGAAIARQDQEVATARTLEPDVLYWLGFDIATGFFGDPHRGAIGNTATGPGSLRVRDSLSAAGQRGFNASAKFHFGRDYSLDLADSPPSVVDGDEVAGLISNYRLNAGLSPVTTDPVLTLIASLHARRMAAADMLAHVLPGEGSFKQRLVAGGFEGDNAVELLFAGPRATSTQSVFDSWRQSPIHDAGLRRAGTPSIGVYAIDARLGSKYGRYWTLVIGQSSGARAVAPAAPAPVPAPMVEVPPKPARPPAPVADVPPDPAPAREPMPDGAAPPADGGANPAQANP